MKSALCRFSAGAAAAVVLYSSLAVFKTISDKRVYTEDTDSESTHETSRETSSETVSDTIDDKTSNESSNTHISVRPNENNSSIEQGEPNSSIDESSDTQSSISQPEPTPITTIEEYLSKLVCTGCGKRCSLLRPRCGRGEMKAETAMQQYYQTYSE